MRNHRSQPALGAQPQESQARAGSLPQAPTAPAHDSEAKAHPRSVRSLVLAWHDEESGDELTVNVRGSERFLEGLRPLGFVPLGERSPSGTGQRLPAVHAAGEGSAMGVPRRRGAGTEDPTRDAQRPGATVGGLGETESAEHHVRWTVRLARPWNPRKA